ncbi:hypothetical protein KDJ56_14900 [Brevibacillus composti]|uniref:Uncharacterized protein n=1 Tax=Brevibacillus composti TaxID=2796470 RepID=A0A7T5JMJ7_9BACL|nr:hypothetical protein [Brevibacillus composti]QQE73199.1 hypothetical protein JD108_14955 [Brevibacillus composti]QUO40280.1 hypothetical protein KDJ56_14900 [Brevibacillus composti]
MLILLTVLVSTTEMSSNVLAFESERADYYEIDTDGDGLKDIYEMEILNPKEKDSDGNGIPDGNEDTDNDGLTNLEEQDLGTNINKADTDGDKLEDYRFNPLKFESFTLIFAFSYASSLLQPPRSLGRKTPSVKEIT